uniref:Uncharacterized protein n=1 Tax=Electrophorus electricus TaxID=8005 RepID=A0A4W4HTA4_ELEEL
MRKVVARKNVLIKSASPKSRRFVGGLPMRQKRWPVKQHGNGDFDKLSPKLDTRKRNNLAHIAQIRVIMKGVAYPANSFTTQR